MFPRQTNKTETASSSAWRPASRSSTGEAARGIVEEADRMFVLSDRIGGGGQGWSLNYARWSGGEKIESGTRVTPHFSTCTLLCLPTLVCFMASGAKKPGSANKVLARDSGDSGKASSPDVGFHVEGYIGIQNPSMNIRRSDPYFPYAQKRPNVAVSSRS